MNRVFLMALMGLDVIIMVASAFVVWDRTSKHLFPKPASSTAIPTKKALEEVRRLREQMLPDNPPHGKIATAKTRQGLRNILFQYRDSTSKRVSIVGEFSRWSPQLMKKDDKHRWSIALKLEPGEYAYNFVVDGKMIRDPSNPKVKKAGQKISSSLLVVKKK